MSAPRKPRVFLLGNPTKPNIAAQLEAIANTVAHDVVLVGCATTDDLSKVHAACPDLLLVLGGDGTILSVARSLGERQIPMVGVNVGKLGYLAELSIDEVEDYLHTLGGADLLCSERALLEVSTEPPGQPPIRSLAVNDCVVQAGPPFRIITLAVRLDGEMLTEFVGDGLIVCTPSGSTAHNMSAGGPILMPGVHGIVLTPLCPHSLTHRPLLVEASAVIEVTAVRCNAGTTISLDGQVSLPLHEGQRVTIRRFAHTMKLAVRPDRPRWHTLTTKLGWGQRPTGR